MGCSFRGTRMPFVFSARLVTQECAEVRAHERAVTVRAHPKIAARSPAVVGRTQESPKKASRPPRSVFHIPFRRKFASNGWAKDQRPFTRIIPTALQVLTPFYFPIRFPSFKLR